MQFAKEFKKSVLGLTIGYLAVGIVLLCYPALMPTLLCYALGLLAVVFGITYIVSYFSRRTLTAFYRIDFAMGAALVLFGIYVFIYPNVIGGMLNLVLGLAIAFDTLLKMQNALDLQRLGNRLCWSVLVLAVITGVLSALLLWNVPIQGMEPMRFIGLCLVVDGCVNVWSYFVLLYALRKHRKEHPDGELPINIPLPVEVLRPEDSMDEKLVAQVQKAIHRFAPDAAENAVPALPDGETDDAAAETETAQAPQTAETNML